MEWKNKKVLVTGSEGLIGKELVLQLEELGADVFKFDLKTGYDIISYSDLVRVFQEFRPEIVMNLFGIKGNPKKTKERPIDFMYPMLIGDTQIIKLAQQYGVKRFLYTSSIAVENPESDKYPAWAKMTAEVLIDAMRTQYPEGTKYCIVRPANVYGRFDNFDNPDAMVVTSFINKMIKDKKLVLDRKGAGQIRDIINAKDVARGMIQAIEGIDAYQEYPVNLCSGKGVKIKDLAKTIADELKNIELEYQDLNLTLGPDKKVMKINWDFKPEISLEEGIKEVIKWNKK